MRTLLFYGAQISEVGSLDRFLYVGCGFGNIASVRSSFTEGQIQEFVDHFIMKLRCVKFARTPEYNQRSNLFLCYFVHTAVQSVKQTFRKVSTCSEELHFLTDYAGLSIVADSLSAIKYAKVEVVRDEDGVIVDFKTTGEFPKYGNDE